MRIVILATLGLCVLLGVQAEKESAAAVSESKADDEVGSEFWFWRRYRNCRRCVSDCSGRDDGDYQSCSGCDVFATCSNGNMIDNRPCPAGLVWDDRNKRCDWSSSTCTGACRGSRSAAESEVEAKSDDVEAEFWWWWRRRWNPNCRRCVNDCTDRENGDYQSCNGCDVFATCSNGILSDNRPCPAGLVWDDRNKRCDWTSNTCSGSCRGRRSSVTMLEDDDVSAEFWWFWWWRRRNPSEPSNPNCDRCVNSCDGKEDGDYQSCNGCDVFVTCSNGLIIDNRPCPGGLVWDDEKKWCDWESSTCTGDCADDASAVASASEDEDVHGDFFMWMRRRNCRRCVNDCSGRGDGDYQSCSGCEVFATCSNGNLIDNRPCPAGLVWDDRQKMCDWSSNTCSGACRRRRGADLAAKAAPAQ